MEPIRNLLIQGFLFLSLIANSQVNLVPNPGFELSVACPTASGILSSASWTSFRGSPDYFNSCSSAAACGTPSNQFGFQAPASGDAYCGFLNIGQSSSIENIWLLN